MNKPFFKKKLLIFLLVFVPALSAKQINTNFSNSQNAQFFFTGLKAIAQLSDFKSNRDSLDSCQESLMLRFLKTISHAAIMIIDPGHNLISKGTHVNAGAWQVLKLLEERKVLQGLEKKSLSDEKVFKLLQKHYHGLEALDDGDGWWKQEEKFGENIKPGIKLLLILTGMAASGYTIYNNGEDKKKSAIARIVQVVSDFALRFLCKDGQYKSNSIVSKLEPYATALPMAYDLFNDVSKYVRKETFSIPDFTPEEVEAMQLRWEKLSYPEKNLREFFLIKDNDGEVSVCSNCALSCFDDNGELEIEYEQLECGHIFCPDCIEDWIKVENERLKKRSINIRFRVKDAEQECAFVRCPGGCGKKLQNRRKITLDEIKQLVIENSDNS